MSSPPALRVPAPLVRRANHPLYRVAMKAPCCSSGLSPLLSNVLCSPTSPPTTDTSWLLPRRFLLLNTMRSL